MKKLIILIALLLVITISLPCYGAGNDTSGQTWVLDTAGSISTTWTDIVWIIWTSISSDAHELVIKENSNGDIIVKLIAKAGIDMLVPFPGNSGHIPGMYISTLGSGYVLVRQGRN